jgi:hypothetical protein
MEDTATVYHYPSMLRNSRLEWLITLFLQSRYNLLEIITYHAHLTVGNEPVISVVPTSSCIAFIFKPLVYSNCCRLEVDMSVLQTIVTYFNTTNYTSTNGRIM